MAKRTNQNQRQKRKDDSDDRTIIKIAPPKKEKKTVNPKRQASSNQKNTRKESTRTENTNKEGTKSGNTRSGSRKPARSTAPQKPSQEPVKKASHKSTESKTSSQSHTPSPPPVQKTPIPNSIPPEVEGVKISQSVAILIDGNNIEMSLTKLTNNKSAVLNFDKVIPKLLHGRGLNRLIYFREGRSISQKLADRLHTHYFGSVVPCHKSADIPLSIQATQLAEKVDTIIILSGDSDYVELVRHVKSKGVRVEIAAIEITTANILKEEADYYSPITEDDAFIVK